MSTYCISDIHGQLDALNIMLNKINFKYDGSDALYIAGDMGDWGSKSIETLLFCKDLQDKYKFITVLMGNHESMMVKYLDRVNKVVSIENLNAIPKNFDCTNWYDNQGGITLEGLVNLDKNTRKELVNWVIQLKYFSLVVINNRMFYITHSMPFIAHKEYSVYSDAYEMMVWDRVTKHYNVMKQKTMYKDAILISGHTISSNYISHDKNGRNRIFKDLDNQYINIDCGAKVFEWRDYGQLACIRLEDLQEFYVNNKEVANSHI